MNDNDFIEYENRTYVNPQAVVDDTNSFVDNLRNVQSSENNRINQQTYNLGTQVPSTAGGLSGAENTYNTRYVTPKVNSMIAGLQQTAQQSALNTAMSNLQNQFQNQYNQAYRNAYAKANSGNKSSGDVETTTDEGNSTGRVELEGVAGGYNVANVYVDDDGVMHTTGEETVVPFESTTTSNGATIGSTGKYTDPDGNVWNSFEEYYNNLMNTVYQRTNNTLFNMGY